MYESNTRPPRPQARFFIRVMMGGLVVVPVLALAASTDCYCNELSSACNSYDPGLQEGQCFRGQTGSDTIMQAMPYFDKGHHGIDPGTVTGVCKYKLGTLINGLCHLSNTLYTANVQSSSAGTQPCTNECGS